MPTKKAKTHNRLHKPTKLEARKPLRNTKGGASQTEYLKINLTDSLITSAGPTSGGN